MFFNEQSVKAFNEAIDIFEDNINKFDPMKIRGNTLRFGRERFACEIKTFIEEKWRDHCGVV